MLQWIVYLPIEAKTTRYAAGTIVASQSRPKTTMTTKTAEGNRCKYVIMDSGMCQSRPLEMEIAQLRKSLEPQAGNIFDAASEALDGAGKTVDRAKTILDDVLAVVGKIEKLVEYGDSDKKNKFFRMAAKRLESLLILVFALSQRSTLVQMLPDILQWINANLGAHESVGLMLYGHIAEMFKPKDNDDDSAWVSCAESPLDQQGGWFTDNWKLLIEGEFGKNLSHAVNLLVAIGIMPEKADTIMQKDFYRMFKVKAIAFGGLSIFTHLAQTMDWVVDGIYPALTTGDFSYLLTSKDEHVLDEMHRACCDMVSMNVTGQIDRLLEKYKIQGEIQVVEYILKCAEMHGKFRRTTNEKLKERINVRLLQYDRFINDIQAAWHAASTREKPFAMLIRGPSSVGKSTVAGIIAHCINLTNGFPEGDQYMTTINGNDKYQSEYKSRHHTVIFDDMGNTKPEHAEGNPLFTLIQFINNMHCCALSPEAEKKGKNDIRVKTVLVTTNTENLHANYFSCNPTSVMRRFDIVLDVRSKSGTRDPSGKILAKYAAISQPDIWDFTLKQIQIHNTGTLTDSHTEKVIMTGGVVDLIDYLEKVTPEHFELQRQLVAASTKVHEKPHCPIHKLYIMPCAKCGPELLCPYIPNAGTMESQLYKAEIDWPDARTMNMWEEDNLDKRNLEEDAYIAWEPQEFDKPEKLGFADTQEVVKFNSCGFKAGVRHIMSETGNTITGIIACAREKLMGEDPKYRIIASAVGLVSGLILVRSFCQPAHTEQGAYLQEVKLHSTTPSQLAVRDNRYQKGLKYKVSPPNASISVTLGSFQEKISKNMCIMFVTAIDEFTRLPIPNKKPRYCITTPTSGGVWNAPWHMFSAIEDGVTFQVEVRQRPKNTIGARRFVELVNTGNCRRIPNADACLIRMPSGGSTYAFDKYYMTNIEDVKVGAPIHIYYLTEESLHEDTYMYTPLGGEEPVCSTIKKVGPIDVHGVDVKYLGVEYELPIKTYEGLCGALVVLAGRNPMIIGHHSAGRNGTNHGAAILLTQKQLEYDKLIHIAETAPMPTKIMGKEVNLGDHVHSQNAVHWIPEEENVSLEILGEHALPTSKFSTDIIPSPLVENLEKVGIYANHAGPERRAVRMARHNDLLTINRVRPAVNPKIMNWAVADLTIKLKKFMDACPKFKDYVHVLSFEDALNGVPGVKGFDPININTSMGFPINQPKFRFLKQSDTQGGTPTMKFLKEIQNEDGTITYSYMIIFDADKLDVEKELENVFETCKRGERLNFVFRANLKDEALSYEKIAKGKIRVFAGAPLIMVIATRMLTLSLINAMTYFPTVFEMAVGVDASGKDWDRLFKYITKYDKICTGDYKNFDKNMSPSFSIASFEIFKVLLTECGFDDMFLKMIDVLATEISYPIYEVDGLIYQATGSTPSGHPLTVVKNGFDNALGKRYAYYAAHYKAMRVDLDPNKGVIPLFHEKVALITYGDDDVMSVKDDITHLFNQLTITKELADIGQVYTSASKGEHVEPFTEIETIDFLKRSFKVHSVLGQRVGALAEPSIEKSLTCAKRPKKGQMESVAQIMAGNLRQALFEYYLHSPELFHKRREDFREVVKGVVDAEGHRVIDYYVEPEEEECIHRFQNSTCVYQQVMDDFKVPYDMQSGEVNLPETPELVRRVRRVAIERNTEYAEIFQGFLLWGDIFLAETPFEFLMQGGTVSTPVTDTYHQYFIHKLQMMCDDIYAPLLQENLDERLVRRFESASVAIRKSTRRRISFVSLVKYRQLAMISYCGIFLPLSAEEFPSEFYIDYRCGKELKTHIIRMRNRFMHRKVRRSSLILQLKQCQRAAKSDKNDQLDFHWSVVHKNFVSECTIKAVNLCRIIWTRAMLEGLFPDEIVMYISKFAPLQYYYRVVFDDDTCAAVVQLCSGSLSRTAHPESFTSESSGLFADGVEYEAITFD